MLPCGHDRPPSGVPLCPHLQVRREALISYVRWYTGSGLDAELLCLACAEAREQGRAIALDRVCEGCFDRAATDVGNQVGIRGTPEVRTRPEPMSREIRDTALPDDLGPITDLAPVDREGHSVWLLLAGDGSLLRFDADSGDRARLAATAVPAEPDHEPWCGHALRRHLHVSPRGEFAAVVNDYGRHGEIVDLRSGQTTLRLFGGADDPETVPFSFAFAEARGRVVAIHRTDWNRLDVSDASNGRLLTHRGPTSYGQGESPPPHYLDYFHGGLYVSSDGAHVLEDGWVWHPVGVPMTWSLESWLSDNVWESEDGPTKRWLCGRNYYWDHAMVWLGPRKVAVGGIGDDGEAMVAGARIFDVNLPGTPGGAWRAGRPWARELSAFAGPAGAFFSDGTSLFSTDQTGLSRWDPAAGVRTGHLSGFQPTHHHRGAGELGQLTGRVLRRWRTAE